MTGKGRILTGDIEAVGLLDDIREGHREDVHLIHLKDMETAETFTFFDDFEDRINAVWLDEMETEKAGNILDGRDWMQDCDVLIFQNISGFDHLALEKTVGFKRNHFQKIDNDMFPYATADTYIMSCLLNPDRKLDASAYSMGLGNIGAHSIKAHGIRCGRHKPDHEDWTRLTSSMIHRCKEDVEIGEDMFLYLMHEWDEQMERKHQVTGKDISSAYWCELRIAFSVARQAARGFAIDVKFINKLIPELDEKITTTSNNFRQHMPLRLRMKKISDAQVKQNAELIKEHGGNDLEYVEYMKTDQRASYASSYWSIVTKAGKYKANIAKYIPEAKGFMQDHPEPPVQGAMTPLIWEEVPLGNRDAVKQILYKYGWRGVNYNDAEAEHLDEHGTLPKLWSGKIDNDALDVWKESGCAIPNWCEGIVEWYVLVSRRTQILNTKDVQYYKENQRWPRQPSKRQECRGILPKARCFDEGEWKGRTAQEYYEKKGAWPTEGEWRVSAVAFSIGTNTFRMRHRNLVKIPRKGLYGKEMRQIFIASPDKQVLGIDASGLELRCLSHFMNNEEYTNIVLEGDIHTHNQKLAGLPDRDTAKKFVYMYIYGAGLYSLSKQIGMSERDMKRCLAKFKEDLPDLEILINKVTEKAEGFGYLLAVDGRQGKIRSKKGKLSLNTALNVLLQMTGSIIVKTAHCIAEDMYGDIDNFPMICHMHDEAQMEINTDEVIEYVYDIPAEDWKQEEKREHEDAEGVWSSPVKVSEKVDTITCKRKFHKLGSLYCKAFKQAGKELGIRCDIAGEYKIGDNWSETH